MKGEEELPRNMGTKGHLRRRGVFDVPWRVWWRYQSGSGEARWEAEGLSPGRVEHRVPGWGTVKGPASQQCLLGSGDLSKLRAEALRSMCLSYGRRGAERGPDCQHPFPGANEQRKEV